MSEETGYWTPAPDRPEQDRDHEQGTALAGDDGEEALAEDIVQFTNIERSGPWMLAYLVARRVTPGEGNGVRLEYQFSPFGRTAFRRISASEFARRAKTSHKRVIALLEAWNRLADDTDGLFPHSTALQPGEQIELPDSKKYPFYGKDGYYRSWDARNVSAERREAVEREAAASGARPSAITYVLTHPAAVKNALLADEATRTAAREALADFDARQAAADAADREAADAVTSQQGSEFDAHRSEREAIAAAARAARDGNEADASMEVFNAMAEIRMAASRALARLHKQHINFTPETRRGHRRALHRRRDRHRSRPGPGHRRRPGRRRPGGVPGRQRRTAVSPRRDAAGWTQAETDVADVMMWLLSNHGQELSYDDIGKGVGIKSKPRLQRAVRLVRVIAADRGDRLERFLPSADPKRRRVFTTRYMRQGNGDEFSARDAMAAARAAMTSVKDMHRATTFEAANPHSIAQTEFGAMAQAAEECITKVAGIDKLGPQAVRRENTSLLTQMIADLEARLTETAG